MRRNVRIKTYDAPAGGWGSAKSVQNILLREGDLGSAGLALTRQNKPDGFQCVSCAWIKPGKPLPVEVCENGVKATAWELTSHRTTVDFFARHTVSALRTWEDYDLEQAGRLTDPLRYDAASDRYVPVTWDEAFAEIGRELRAIRERDPKRAVFYSSGRSSNEASYLYALFARLYGNNNLPDSSNMCHETTSAALPQSIGSPVGTVTLDDFAKTDMIFFFGQNVGSNSPRMLHPLQAASRRGVPIAVFNPLRERGLERFTNPQSPVEMALRQSTRIATHYLQVRAAGDLAALTGLCKCLVERDAVDHDFIAQHTHGFEAFAAWLRERRWETIERCSGLERAALEEVARTYAASGSAIGIYGMGLTQHHAGVTTVRMLVNLLLLRGNVGKAGAGICPVRGHSNVQGQRTVGITEKTSLVPLDKLAEQFGFEPPREDGLNTVEACEALLDGKIDAMVLLGGNLARAVPDRERIEAVWPRVRLTVNVATKLNRTHLLPGQVAYLLPVLGRLELDRRNSGEQALSIEDTSGCIHASWGVKSPASPQLISEIDVVCRLAQAVLPNNPRVRWDAYARDYAEIRKEIAATYPETFHDYEKRMREPGGMHRHLPAKQRIWKTDTGRANFVIPETLDEVADMPASGPDVLRLITLRSNDQFNTTIYGYDDRFRGISGTRMVVLMNEGDIAKLGLCDGETVGLETDSRDGIERRMGGFRVTAYNIPPGCIAAYYPEANALLPLGHYAQGSKTPAAKSIPVRVRREVTDRSPTMASR